MNAPVDPDAPAPAALAAAQVDLDRLRAALCQQVLGKEDVVGQVVAAMIAGGHILIEDVPGVGKTTLAIALAQSIGGVFRRIQFTSDLLPSDVIGVPVFRSREEIFVFKPGPLFANVVLADEINRTTPKTQSALLEAMQEGSVSVDGAAHILPRPFLVVATQNPVEHHGTYPLPESQLDRFMLKIRMGYPARDFEAEVIRRHGRATMMEASAPQPVLTTARILAIQRLAPIVRVEESIVRYILDLAEATRRAPELELGVSTRGVLMLYRMAQARALCEGRSYCLPDDVKALARPVLGHRLIVRATAQHGLTDSDAQRTAEQLLGRILQEVETPR